MYYLVLDHVRDWTTNITIYYVGEETYKILKSNDNLIHSILFKKKKTILRLQMNHLAFYYLSRILGSFLK